MIYTLGHKESYEQYFKLYGKPGKKGRCPGYAGGSVWKNPLDIIVHKVDNKLDDYDIFGVDADWDKHTTANLFGNSYNDLLRDSNLIRIN